MEPIFSLPECFLATVCTEAGCSITEVSSALQQSPGIHDDILALLSSTSLHYRRLKDHTCVCIPSDMMIFVVIKWDSNHVSVTQHRFCQATYPPQHTQTHTRQEHTVCLSDSFGSCLCVFCSCSAGGRI